MIEIPYHSAAFQPFYHPHCLEPITSSAISKCVVAGSILGLHLFVERVICLIRFLSDTEMSTR